MKLIQIFSSPVVQIITFCIILVGSAEFGGPYGFFLYRAVQEGYLYAIAGIIGILITALSFSNNSRNSVIQFSGLVLMVLSLLIFFFSSEDFMNMYVFKQVLPLVTLLLFIMVVVAVTSKFLKAYK